MSRRSNLIALGLTTIVIGAVAATSRHRRSVPPSSARRAFVVRDETPVRASPNETAEAIGTLGAGSELRVGGAGDVIAGFVPIVREWVNEDGSRTARNLGWVLTTDLRFEEPTVPVTGGVGCFWCAS